MLKTKTKRKWVRFWMRYSDTSFLGRLATRFAESCTPPYYGRIQLANICYRGYISQKALVKHDLLTLGENILIGDNVLIYQDRDGGSVMLSDRTHLYRDTIVQTGGNGSLSIGANTHIQPRCQFSAYMSPISIGDNVEISPNCGFYSYNHNISTSDPISAQPLTSKGGIKIENDVWIGFGVVVLDGVAIGQGAVIGAGSVVTKSLPPYCIAAGNPAQVIKERTSPEQFNT